MKTQLEIEKKVLDYYKKHIENDINERTSEIDNNNYYVDLVKMPYIYIDYNEPCNFMPTTIYDFAVYSKKEKKIIYIEYPWRLENDKLTYNKIYL